MKLLRLTLLMSFLIALGCNKDNEDTVPLVRVNISLRVTDPQFIDLNPVGGWVYLSAGSRGLIVYRFSNDEFRVYDRHCTYQPSNSCAQVSVEPNNITALDDCCGSQFILASEGMVSRGPASLPLTQYRTSFDGITLRIFN